MMNGECASILLLGSSLNLNTQAKIQHTSLFSVSIPLLLAGGEWANKNGAADGSTPFLLRFQVIPAADLCRSTA